MSNRSVPSSCRRSVLAGAIIATAMFAGHTGAALAAPGGTEGQWVLRASTVGAGFDYLAVNRATNTLFVDQFVPPGPATRTAFDTSTGVTIGAYDNGVAPQLSTASINATTNRMYVPSFGSGEVLVADATTGAPITSIARPDWMPWGTAADASTNTVYVTDGNDRNLLPVGNITVIDAAMDTIVTTVDAANTLGWPAVSEQKRTLYVPVEGGTQAESSVLVFDTVTNTVVSSIHGTSPDQLVGPTMAIVDDALGRLFVLNANTAGAVAGGYASITVIDTATNAIIGEPIRLDADFVPSDRLGYDPSTRLLTLGGNYNDAATDTNPNPDNVPSMIWTIDAGTGDVLERTPLGPSVSVFDTAISTGTLYVTVDDPDGVGRLLSYDWVETTSEPTATPTSTPAAEPAAEPSARLPDTGWDGTLAAWIAGGLVLLGAGLGVTGALRRRSTRG